MKKDAQKAAKLASLKKQLEDIAGREIDASEDQLVKLFIPLASHSVEREDGTTTFERFFPEGKYCSQTRLLDVSGRLATRADGRNVFLLSKFLCYQVSFEEPVCLVATPHSTSACYVTVTYDLVPDPNKPQFFNDLQITIFSWTPNGTAAPNVSFHWRCRLVSFETIF